MSCIANLSGMNQTIMRRWTVTGALLVSLIALGSCNPTGDTAAPPIVASIASHTDVASPPTTHQTDALATNTSSSPSASDIPNTNTPSPRSKADASATNTPFHQLTPSSFAQEKEDNAQPNWDLVVLGWIDANWLSQHDPSPHVRYTRVLAGIGPGSQDEGQLALLGIAEHLLPSDGTPIYRSQQQEICFLKKEVVPGYEDADVYQVVDVLPATPENMSRFIEQ